MKLVLAFIIAVSSAAGGASLAFAAEAPRPVDQSRPASIEPNPRWVIEGEKRYRVNCGRCHQAPHRFEPRVMATAVRHMRVRGMLTNDDMNYVLYYMTH
jgi:cytochrome c5